VAVVGALLTLVWAGAGLLGPTIGGAASERLGDRTWFLGLAIFGLASAGWMWARRDRDHGPIEAPSPAA
jgi:MFS family permease